MKQALAERRPRAYEQRARAAAAEATSRRILDAFFKRAESELFELITLDALADDAGVTVQTIIRKFGGKVGVLEAAAKRMEKEVLARRTAETGNLDQAVDGLTDDYEASGRFVLHLLNQEDRNPALKQTTDFGRRCHREWLVTIFAGKLKALTPAKRAATLDALVVATDIYVWKVVRIDMGRSVSAFKALVKRLLTGVLASN